MRTDYHDHVVHGLALAALGNTEPEERRAYGEALHRLIQSAPQRPLYFNVIDEVIASTSGLFVRSEMENPFLNLLEPKPLEDAWATVDAPRLGRFVMFFSTRPSTVLSIGEPRPRQLNWHELAASVFPEHQELSAEQWGAYLDIVESMVEPIDR